MSDMPIRNTAGGKLPLPGRDTKSSSFYGADGNDSIQNTPVIGFTSPNPSAPLPSTSPGNGLRKSDGSLWGEPGPAVDEGVTGFTPKKAGGIGVAKSTVGEEVVDAARSPRQSDMSWLKIHGT